MTRPLTQSDVESWMNKEGAASGWSYDAERPALCRTFAFGSFSEAFAFMARAALAAEKTDHHPDWQNSYNTVSVRLSTHSAGGVTEKDLAMAEAMDAIVGD